jgi:anti-anti-sigma factor
VTSETSLHVERVAGDGHETLVLKGELDLTNVAELDRALFETTAPHVLLDLGELGYLDSAGIRTIDLTHRRLRDEGRTLSVVAPAGSRAAWTLRVAGFPDGLLHDSTESALGA